MRRRQRCTEQSVRADPAGDRAAGRPAVDGHCYSGHAVVAHDYRRHRSPYRVSSSDTTCRSPARSGATTSIVISRLPASVGAATTVAADSPGCDGVMIDQRGVTVRPRLLLPASITVTGNPSLPSASMRYVVFGAGTAQRQYVLTGAGGRALPGRAVALRRRPGEFQSSLSPGRRARWSQTRDRRRRIKTASLP